MVNSKCIMHGLAVTSLLYKCAFKNIKKTFWVLIINRSSHTIIYTTTTKNRLFHLYVQIIVQQCKQLLSTRDIYYRENMHSCMHVTICNNSYSLYQNITQVLLLFITIYDSMYLYSMIYQASSTFFPTVQCGCSKTLDFQKHEDHIIFKFWRYFMYQVLEEFPV